jgi:hypothetical protein
MRKILSLLGLMLLGGCVTAAFAQLIINPPVSDVHINGHTYTNSQLQANPAGWLGGVANDVGAVTALYPTGRFNPRIPLTADLTMFVGGGGASDSNNCLVGNPCATIQRPFDLLRDQYDLAGKTATVQVADGTYSRGLFLSGNFIGQQRTDNLRLVGNAGTPANVVVSDPRVPSTQNDYASGVGIDVYATSGANLRVTGIKFGGGYRAINASRDAKVDFDAVNFGVLGDLHVTADNGAIVIALGNYSITGGANFSHFGAFTGGRIACGTTGGGTQSVTISGTPGFSFFALATQLSTINCSSSRLTFTGSATGPRYYVDTNSLIATNGSGATYFPGNAAGTATIGGIYQ